MLLTTATPATDPETFWSRAAEVFLGVPLRILLIIVVTTVLVMIVRRVINRTVKRFADGWSPRWRRDSDDAVSPDADPETSGPSEPIDLAEDQEAATGEAAAADEAAVDASTRSGDPDELAGRLLRERRVQRANAIGSLLNSVVTAFAVGVALLTILPLLGIDIAPLLTSAGVLGVALGFGAQNLVKDYLSGIFIVLEDQFGVGDTIEVASVVGTVEEVTLRVTRLRDLTGVVWYVRNGEILTVGNRSQGWTLAIADLPVAADTSLDEVRAAVADVATRMMADPALHDSLLTPPDYAGVESVSGEAMVVRVVARAAATEQVSMSRKLREELRNEFTSRQIRIPVVLRMPGAAAGSNVGTAGAAGGTGAEKKGRAGS